jgi:hypothetical protein
MTKNLKELTENFLGSKTTINASLGLHKGRSSLRKTCLGKVEKVTEFRAFTVRFCANLFLLQ